MTAGLAHDFPPATPAAWQGRVAEAAGLAHRALARWGAWEAAVRLVWLADRAALLEGAPFALRGLAERTEVRLWAPWLWPDQPDDRALLRLIGHELAHAWWLQRTTTSGQREELPLWLREGWSVLLESQPAPALPRHLKLQERLALAQGDAGALAETPNDAYAVAEALCAQLLTSLGRRGLTGLQRALRDGLPAEDALQRAGLADPAGWLVAAAAK